MICHTEAALALDIETVPTLASLAVPYIATDRPPPGNYKSEEAIARWREQDREKWETDRIKEFSLSPRLGRVAAVGLAYALGPETAYSWALAVTAEEQEAEVLAWVWRVVAGHGALITFNGLAFDLPFLITRSILNNVPVPEGFNAAAYLRRYSTTPHFDVRAVLGQWDRFAPGTLDDWSRAVGIPVRETAPDHVWQLAKAGRWDDIAEHGLQDAIQTHRLAQVVGPWHGLTLPAADFRDRTEVA